MPRKLHVTNPSSDSLELESLPCYSPMNQPQHQDEGSGYSLEDLPRIAFSSDTNCLGTAAPSSMHTQSQQYLLSPSQSRTFTRAHFGHSSAPNVSSVYQQNAPQEAHRFVASSQPLLMGNDIHADKADGEEAQPFSGFPVSEPTPHGLSTNFVSLYRKSTLHTVAKFPFSTSSPNPGASIFGKFIIDPHLRLPGGLLKLVDLSGCTFDGGEVPRDQSRRENLVLEAEDGMIDVDVVVVGSPSARCADEELLQPSMPRRSTDKRRLQPGTHPLRLDRDRRPGEVPTRLKFRLKDGRAGACKSGLIARIVCQS